MAGCDAPAAAPVAATGGCGGCGVRVSVEGNAGSGKTAALRAVEALGLPGVRVLPSPAADWAPLVRLFEASPADWALALQLKVLLSFRSAPAPGPGEVHVHERSPLSCRHVFGQLLFNEGRLTQDQWGTFKDYCDALGWEPDAVVFLDSPPAAGGDEHARRVDFQYETLLKYLPPRTVVARVPAAPDADAAAAAAADAVRAAIADVLAARKKNVP